MLRERSHSLDAQWNLLQHLMVSMLTGGMRTARVRDAELMENFHLNCKPYMITNEDVLCIWNQSLTMTAPTWSNRDSRTARGRENRKRCQGKMRSRQCHGYMKSFVFCLCRVSTNAELYLCAPSVSLRVNTYFISTNNFISWQLSYLGLKLHWKKKVKCNSDLHKIEAYLFFIWE